MAQMTAEQRLALAFRQSFHGWPYSSPRMLEGNLIGLLAIYALPILLSNILLPSKGRHLPVGEFS